jgi:hypothetical protein
MRDVTILTAHFKDFSWIELFIEQIRNNTDISRLREILIINQDRCEESRKGLQKLHELVRVLEYPVSEKHFLRQGHDHAAVLNAAVLEGKGRYICILDSDSHPISPDWLDHCGAILKNHDAILARCPDRPGTHPCFMVVKREHIALPLRFDKNLFEDGSDTGRLIGKQLISAGERVYLAEHVGAFSGMWGSIYLGVVYHHGSGSFHLSGPLLTAQVTWSHRFFRERVLKDRCYSLHGIRKVQWGFAERCFKLRDRYFKPFKTRCSKIKNRLLKT